MKYRLVYISTFHAEILSIADYLAEYPKKAARIFSQIDKALMKLENLPEMYPAYRYAPDFRCFTVEEYLVLYKINYTDKTVEIHHLFHGRMDILARL
jgi:plasmid stabilization system protein ParE